ncbi:MAG: pyridoxamine 5'-phosphate oxidase family protein [Deltaproteobacteria bacterium]|nr:pyridoxamine 5'-phosphate oxidase family protein [Deltaproteobacteria bacterium]
MDLKEYFDSAEGTGVLATADAEGKVDVAVFARPHVMEDGTLAFIMRDRLSHSNVMANPSAAFLFVEEGPGYRGKRFYLTKTGEEQDTAFIESLRRRSYLSDRETDSGPVFLVRFKVDKILPAVGTES